MNNAYTILENYKIMIHENDALIADILEHFRVSDQDVLIDFVRALADSNKTIAEKALDFARLYHADDAKIMQDYQTFYDNTLAKLAAVDEAITRVKNSTLS